MIANEALEGQAHEGLSIVTTQTAKDRTVFIINHSTEVSKLSFAASGKWIEIRADEGQETNGPNKDIVIVNEKELDTKELKMNPLSINIIQARVENQIED